TRRLRNQSYLVNISDLLFNSVERENISSHVVINAIYFKITASDWSVFAYVRCTTTIMTLKPTHHIPTPSNMILLKVRFLKDNIAQGPYTQHKANQLVTFVATLERRQRELLHHANKVMKIDVICVSREARGLVELQLQSILFEERFIFELFQSWIREGPTLYAMFVPNRLQYNRTGCFTYVGVETF
ncbi:unnamed protein product, partial [Heligmosomoides polygyrus]|uniref:Neur_chan_LBD domain-containing protein n=1 Tax=Heligmosomoides polygyrus TaxID=6339 RepID=A0A183FPG1_HELPZ